MTAWEAVYEAERSRTIRAAFNGALRGSVFRIWFESYEHPFEHQFWHDRVDCVVEQTGQRFSSPYRFMRVTDDIGLFQLQKQQADHQEVGTVVVNASTGAALVVEHSAHRQAGRLGMTMRLLRGSLVGPFAYRNLLDFAVCEPRHCVVELEPVPDLARAAVRAELSGSGRLRRWTRQDTADGVVGSPATGRLRAIERDTFLLPWSAACEGGAIVLHGSRRTAMGWGVGVAPTGGLQIWPVAGLLRTLSL